MELIIGPRTKITPFTDRAVAVGMTKAMVYNHTVLPMGTDDPAADYRALTTAAAIWDVGCERQVQIAGPDAHRLVTYLCARDLRDLEVGAARYAPMCDHEGRLVNDPMALRIDETTFWLSIADSDVLLWARAVAGEGGYDVDVTEPDVWPLAIQGPRSADVVAAALGDWVRELRFFRFAHHVHNPIPMIVCRSGWSGQDGFELFLMDGAQGEELWDLLWEAGRPFGLAVGAPNNAERIESFLLSFGGDTDPETDPDEAGISRFVSQEDDGDHQAGHDFIGKAALVARRASGTQRRLVGLVIDGDPPSPMRSPRTVQCPDGHPVGTLRALARSPKFDTNIGLALLDPPWFEPDTALRVNLDGIDRSAMTTQLPFNLPPGSKAAAGPN